MAATIHIHHRHFITTEPESWYSFYRTMEGGRLSRPRHCSKGVQPVPKAVYHSDCRDKHNCPRWDSNLGPLTLQSGMLPLCHCNTWPSQQSREELTDTSYNSIAQEQRCMLVTYTCKQSQCLKLFEFDSIGIDRFLCQFQHAAPGFQSQLGHFTLADKHNIGNKWLDSFINKTCN